MSISIDAHTPKGIACHEMRMTCIENYKYLYLLNCFKKKGWGKSQKKIVDILFMDSVDIVHGLS